MPILQRHLLRSFFAPFFFGLAVTTFILMIDVLQDYFSLFLEKGVAFSVATEVLVLSLGHTLALSIPMAVLVGVLMGVGSLAADQEITAMKASGISLYRISLPLLLVGLLLSGGMMAYNHWVLPESNFRLRGLILAIHEQRPMLSIQPGTLTDINEQYTIYVRNKNDRSGELRAVRLYQRDGRGDPAPDVIVAKSGHIEGIAPGRVQLDLYDGEFHRIPDSEDAATYNRTRFKRQIIHIDLGPQGSDALPHQRGERELNVTMLREAAAEQRQEWLTTRQDSAKLLLDSTRDAYAGQAVEPKTEPVLGSALAEHRALMSRLERGAKGLQVKATIAENHRVRESRYLVELHKKFAIPVACAVFVLLGVPLAIVSSRGGRGVSVGLSLAAFTLYYLFLTGGEKLADRGRLDPALSMWAANIVLGGLGIWMLWAAVQETKSIRLRRPRRSEPESQGAP